MLTGGERPFTGENANTTGTTGEKVRWEQVYLEPPSPRKYNGDISPQVEAVVMQCLAKHPEERWQIPVDLLNAFEHACVGIVAPVAKLTEAEVSVPQPPKVEQEVEPAPKQVHKVSAPAKKEAAQVKGTPQFQPAVSPSRPPTKSFWKKYGLLVGVVGIAVVVGMLGLRNKLANEARIMVSEADGMEMVYVPAGTFIMGSNDGDSDEKPVHEVYLDAYWIDKYEVTNEQYAECVAEGDCDTPSRKTYYSLSQYADHPVVYVSWNDARDYCKWVARRLPSEAEWEKAARGTDERTYPWGDSSGNAGLLNYAGNEGRPVAVGSYPDGASPYGAMDMAGNVWEWVADWYDGDYYSVSSGENPAGPATGDARVLRGGSWNLNNRSVRSADRDRSNPHSRGSSGGFRCAGSPN